MSVKKEFEMQLKVAKVIEKIFPKATFAEVQDASLEIVLLMKNAK